MGTILSLGILGPMFSTGDNSSTPFFFNRPQILQKVSEALSPARTQDEMVVDAVQQASPAVVSVVATKDVPVIEQYYVDPFANDPFFQQYFGNGGDSGFRIPQYRQNGTQNKEISAGTGFLVSADGMIVTNKHVVADTAASYTILMNDGRKLDGKVLARDPVQDLAVLKIDGNNYPFLKLGDSGGVKIGQTVIAIGNALGEFRNTVSLGVISGLQRSIVANGSPDGPESLQELIQTDAAINPGNSGGPLLNLKGEVIGIDVAVAQGAQNIGFALPINKAARDVQSVQQTGKIIYPFLGVRYTLVTKGIADANKLGRTYGAWIKGTDTDPAVVLNSPASKAGLKEGDIVLKVNSDAINSDNGLSSLIQKYKVGDQITLRVYRDSQETDVKVTLEEKK